MIRITTITNYAFTFLHPAQFLLKLRPFFTPGLFISLRVETFSVEIGLAGFVSREKNL